MTAPEELLQASIFFSENSAGYESWGNVQVLEVWMRKDDVACWKLDLNGSKEQQQIEKIDFDKAGFAGMIFKKRKKINFLLITRQENASQVKEEIPPILDDQAQLLGVSVRIAEGEWDVMKALNGRYAALMSNGNSICLGATLDDAWVAAQLLEKTSKAFLYAKALGGAKSINRMEAWLMQQFYQLKYSKEASRNV
jgi:hypothetical protein